VPATMALAMALVGGVAQADWVSDPAAGMPAAGVAASGVLDRALQVDPQAQQRNLGVLLEAGQAPDGNALAVRGASVVIIGVKPAMVPETLAALAGDLAPDALVISVAAGVTTATMEAIVSQPILRAMPNTPSLIGKGVTGLAAGSRATAEQVALGRAVFETVGTVVEVPESQIDALSTISGSGPAYVFYLVEQLTRTAVNLGFTPAQAAELVTGTFLGSVELLVASGREPEELRRQVTSPNGTTQRAIAELEKADLTGLFDRATASALARAKEMAEGR